MIQSIFPINQSTQQSLALTFNSRCELACVLACLKCTLKKTSRSIQIVAKEKPFIRSKYKFAFILKANPFTHE